MKMDSEQYIQNCRAQAASLFDEDEPVARIKYELELLRALVRTVVMMVNQQENDSDTRSD